MRQQFKFSPSVRMYRNADIEISCIWRDGPSENRGSLEIQSRLRRSTSESSWRHVPTRKMRNTERRYYRLKSNLILSTDGFSFSGNLSPTSLKRTTVSIPRSSYSPLKLQGNSYNEVMAKSVEGYRRCFVNTGNYLWPAAAILYGVFVLFELHGPDAFCLYLLHCDQLRF